MNEKRSWALAMAARLDVDDPPAAGDVDAGFLGLLSSSSVGVDDGDDRGTADVVDAVAPVLARRRLRSPGRPGLLIHGSPGSGKSTLVHALAGFFDRDEMLLSTDPGLRAHAVYAELLRARAAACRTLVSLVDEDWDPSDPELGAAVEAGVPGVLALVGEVRPPTDLPEPVAALATWPRLRLDERTAPDIAALVAAGVDRTRAEDTWLAEARSGDERALHRLVREFTPLVWSVARGSGQTSGEAEHTVQSVWHTATAELPRLPSGRALTAWLVSTTRGTTTRARPDPTDPVPDGLADRAAFATGAPAHAEMARPVEFEGTRGARHFAFVAGRLHLAVTRSADRLDGYLVGATGRVVIRSAAGTREVPVDDGGRFVVAGISPGLVQLMVVDEERTVVTPAFP